MKRLKKIYKVPQNRLQRVAYWVLDNRDFIKILVQGAFGALIFWLFTSSFILLAQTYKDLLIQ